MLELVLYACLGLIGICIVLILWRAILRTYFDEKHRWYRLLMGDSDAELRYLNKPMDNKEDE